MPDLALIDEEPTVQNGSVPCPGHRAGTQTVTSVPFHSATFPKE